MYLDYHVHIMEQICLTGSFDCTYFSLAWVIVTLGASGGFLYLIITKLLYFLSNPSQIDLTITYQDKLTFPAVTICNQNPMR